MKKGERVEQCVPEPVVGNLSNYISNPCEVSYLELGTQVYCRHVLMMCEALGSVPTTVCVVGVGGCGRQSLAVNLPAS